MAANGRLILPDDRLPFTPAQFGLLDTATEIPDMETYWRMGLTFEPLCADASSTFAECLSVTRGSPPDVVDDTPGPPDAKASTFEHQIRGVLPFTVYAETKCSSQGGWERARKRAADALTRAEDRIVETVFWTGTAGGTEVVFPHLAATSALVEEGSGSGSATLQEAATDVTPGGTALGIVDALGVLEREIGSCYDGVGTIHVSRRLIPWMADHNQLVVKSGLITTLLGTKVAAGRGYPETGPDGTTATNSVWMFATGEVFYHRDDIFQPTDRETFDRADNTVIALAERTYVIGWDCCILAIEVSTA